MRTPESFYFDAISGWFNIAMLDDGSGSSLTSIDQASRPHVFVNKLRRRAGGNKELATRDAPSRNLSVTDWAAIYAAAEFADHSHMCLDVHVTLDFARMGIFEPTKVQEALSRFIRCYGAWASDRHLPVAWIYRIEMSSATNYHAHVLVYVPGWLPWYPVRDAPERRAFRAWAQSYTQRNLGEHIPKAIRVRYGFPESRFTHWLLVSYLMKGFDRAAIVCSPRNSPDGLHIRLGDLIPMHYCDPGPVALNRHYGICDNLGPKQRQFGAPKGFEANLPRQPNWATFSVEGNNLTSLQKMDVIHTLPKPTPFVSSYEDGIRDIRRLYPAQFHESVTRLKAEQAPVTPGDLPGCNFSSLADQLAAIDE